MKRAQIIFTPEQKASFVSGYPIADDLVAFSAQFGLTKREAIDRAARYGLKRDKAHRRWKKLKMDTTDEKILRLYVDEKLNTYEIAKKFNVSGANIARIVRKYGKTRSAYETHRIYDVDQTFFTNIDTKEKAWVLGWMITDGSLHEERGISISLEETDASYVLPITKQYMSYDGPIEYIAERDQPRIDDPSKMMHISPQLRLRIYSTPLARSLIAHGFMRDKSCTVPLMTKTRRFVRWTRNGEVENTGLTTVS